MKRVIMGALALALIVHGVAAPVSASISPVVPEIDPASISAGLAILGGGVLLLRARRNRK